jgi:hypothetical protein
VNPKNAEGKIIIRNVTDKLKSIKFNFYQSKEANKLSRNHNRGNLYENHSNFVQNNKDSLSNLSQYHNDTSVSIDSEIKDDISD